MDAALPLLSNMVGNIKEEIETVEEQKWFLYSRKLNRVQKFFESTKRITAPTAEMEVLCKWKVSFRSNRLERREK